MSCPAWRPDCQASAAVDAVGAAADGVATAYHAATGALHLAGAAYGAVGDLTEPIGGPLVAGAGLFVLIGVWILWKLFGIGRRVVPAAVAGYTGVDIQRVNSPQRAAETAGERARRRRETGKGPATQAHLAQSPAEVVDRQDDRQGRPVRLVVCADGPGDATAALGARMVGHTWQHAGSRRCNLDRTRRHFTLTQKGHK